MGVRSGRRRRSVFVHLTTASALVALMLSGCAAEGDGEGDGDCVSTRDYFEEKVWSAFMSKKCMGCHNPQGLAKDSKLVLQTSSQPGYLDNNLATLQHVAAFDFEGKSILLLKPSAQITHGGGEQISRSGSEYEALAELVSRFKEPVECEDKSDDTYLAGVVIADPVATLRKAALALVGRLPTTDEEAAVAEGGEEALDQAIRGMLEQEAFIDRLKVIFNDLFLTDKYLGGNDATNLLSTEDFPNRRWYDEDSEYTGADASYKELGRKFANNSAARAPLELIAHVVRENRPFSEILTADYMLVNPFTSIIYGVEDQVSFADAGDPSEWKEVKLSGYPHAGILTSPMFLNRFPSTDTNRNRHRSRMVYRFFLATDILKLAERPIDPTAIVDHNPTMFNPDCTVCHATMDPVAGAFQNWSNNGRHRPPEEGWYPDMRPPGFGEELIPQTAHSSSLHWLAERITQDERFAISVTQILFKALTGREVLTSPDGSAEDGAYAAKKRAFDFQDKFLTEIAGKFKDADYDLKTAVLEIVKSPYFRARDTTVPLDDVRAAELDAVGMGRLLPPEDLSRKIEAVTGYPWVRNYDKRDYLMGDYLIFYGGIDSEDVTQRITSPNGIMANVIWRMANEVSCTTVSQDFTRNRAERLLFPHVEMSFVPEDDNGFTIPGAVQSIKENIQYLHKRVLGENLPLTDPEIDRTYQLFYETWAEGYQAVRFDEISEYLPSQCRATRDFWTGEDLHESKQVSRDDFYTVRAWMAVMSYLLSDYKFLYE